MIKCPNCQNEEPTGAIFCSNCGAQLLSWQDTTHKTSRYDTSKETGEYDNIIESPILPLELLDYPLVLQVISTNEFIPVTAGDEITLGRASKGQPIIPDIDFSPYNAYEEGVSRLHATLRFEEGQITITDLGSVNGTKINGERIPSNIKRPLHNGDIISLGRLKLQVIINQTIVED